MMRRGMSSTRTLFASLLMLGACASEPTGSTADQGGPGGGKADSTTTSLEVVVRTPARKATLKVACIESFNFENESNGMSLFFHSSSYPTAAGLKSQGLTTMVPAGGAACERDGSNLPYVEVAQFDSAADINAKIMAAGGYVEAEVVFYNYSDLSEAFRAETAASVDQF
jgi:hypothetical protein